MKIKKNNVHYKVIRSLLLILANFKRSYQLVFKNHEAVSWFPLLGIELEFYK